MISSVGRGNTSLSLILWER